MDTPTDKAEALPPTGARREPLEFRVEPECVGLRVDQALVRLVAQRSRAYLQRCVRLGCVRLNGQPCRPADRVRAGDAIRLEWPDEKPIELKPEAIHLDILAEDDDILVLNKPPGLVVHPATGNWSGTLVNALLFHDEENFGDLVDENLRPGVVHRLDRDTSGVMVVAKNEAARKALKLAFFERDVEKTYLALVLGEFGAVTGRIDAPIGRHPVNRLKMAVVQEGGKLAGTRYRVLNTTGDVTLVEVHIETGRTHQIRVHFAHLKHPVLGDPLYGGHQRDAPIVVPRQMLHAWKLVFPHPRTGVMREYMAAPPMDFQAALVALGFTPIGHPESAQNPAVVTGPDGELGLECGIADPGRPAPASNVDRAAGAADPGPDPV